MADRIHQERLPRREWSRCNMPKCGNRVPTNRVLTPKGHTVLVIMCPDCDVAKDEKR